MSELTFQEKLTKVQSELKAPKNQFNKFGNYKYRNCEDILEALKPVLSKYNLALKITDEPKEILGLLYMNSRVTVWDTEGTTAESEAQAFMTLDKKGMSSEQATGSASSYARKYALNGLFLIDDTKEIDSMDNSRQSNAATKDTSSAPKTKTRLPNSGAAFDKVKVFLENGGSMEEVRKKYNVSTEQENKLNSLLNQ